MKANSEKEIPVPIFLNKIVDKRELKKLTSWAFRNHGIAKAAAMSDKLKELGFYFATKAGISLSLEDLRIPPAKKKLLDKTTKEINLTEKKYARGEITGVERFQKVIDTWNNASESLKNEVVKYFKNSDPLNSVYMMAFSGARGNISQVRQLVGMRGLMSDPQGQIIDLPIASNFREGLTVTEYFISSYGARKGLVDTALRTADSGYLTRRLVDVAQDVIVRENDCGTNQGIVIEIPSKHLENTAFWENLLLGRVLAENIYDKTQQQLISFINQDIDSQTIKNLIKANVNSILVRSPLTCESRTSICQRCYGWNLAHSKIVDLGEAVGIIAAQSIGEPGTQLTMRTFHTGGVFTGELSNQIIAPTDGLVSYSPQSELISIRTKHGEIALKTLSTLELSLTDLKNEKQTFILKTGSTVFVENNSIVSKEQILAELPVKSQFSTEKAQKYLIADISGKVYFSNLVIEETNINNNTTRTVKKEGLVWILSSQIYTIPDSAEILVRKNQSIQAGSILAQLEVVNKYQGLVRLPNSYNNNSDSKRIQIIVESLLFSDSRLLFTKLLNNDYDSLLETSLGYKFSILVHPGSQLRNEQTIAILDSDLYSTATGGIVKYLDLPVSKKRREDHSYDILGPGYILWIPEETHKIDRDSSLLLVSNNQMVEEGTEIFKNVFCVSEGIVEIIRKEDIVHEINIKPGKLHKIYKFNNYKGKQRGFLRPGEKIDDNLIADKLVYWEYIKQGSEQYILLRSVIIYAVPDEVPALEKDFQATTTSLCLKTVRRVMFKDGEKVKSVKGVELVKTYLVVEIKNLDPFLTTICEFVKDQNSLHDFKMQLLLVEDLLIKQEIPDNFRETNKITRILVQNNQLVKKGSVIAKTEILCANTGLIEEVTSDSSKSRRIGILTEADKVNIVKPLTPLLVKTGEWIAQGDFITEDLISDYSGYILEINQEFITIRTGRPYLVSIDTLLYVDNNDLIRYNEVLASLIFERTKTGDIVQGLPRIEEILEARKKTDGNFNPHRLLEYLFFKYLLNENLSLSDAAKLSFQNIQLLLVKEIQSVYHSQNVDIANKHIEVIVKQMTSKVKVIHGGNTGYLPGELVELHKINVINSSMEIMGKKSAIYQPVLLGITKASLNTDSFISAASFQETTKVLTEAALGGKFDWLKGLKENVIIGRLIPAGTGFNTYYSNNINLSDTRTTDSSYYLSIQNYDGNQTNTDDIILDDRTARNYSINIVQE
uniref:RNA polymerase beta'' subunit n=1 Tax=Madagascaria erythrocladioides TaxID=753684 RepID=UPI001BEF2FCA|nr:RNA polymerase beta'' subunit [Madagascaria erythrocladioides]QUE28986.1 RNA polymerase beta'' subunit [Madagascaria erythrocladioides]UNJ16537.1 RNA polymerase beta'' subunit [Madagascaria erythrocladioides]